MKLKYNVLLPILCIVLLNSCNIYNPSEPTPSYIHIDNIGVTITDPSSQGTASSKITDAWVYIDDDVVGCYEMPCTFPVLWDGTHTLKIRGGIKVNGIAANRAPYPFLDFYSQAITLQKGVITNVSNVKVKYLSSAHFYWIEDFEGTGRTIDTTNVSDVALNVVSAPPANVFEGGHSAVAYLKSNNTMFECSSVNRYAISPYGDAFLEINYKCNHEFTISLAAYTVATGGSITNYQPPLEVITLNPSTSWNKAYIYITPTIKELESAGANANQFQLFMMMQNPTSADSIGFAIDNLKLIQ